MRSIRCLSYRVGLYMAVALLAARAAQAGTWADAYEAARERLVLSLPFNEGRGAASKDAVRGQSAAIHDARWISGASSLIAFPEDTEKALTLEDPSPERKAFTVEAWCKPQKTDTGYLVLKKYAFGFPNFAGDGKVNVYVRRDNEKDWGLTLENAVEANAWQHYVLTCDGRVVWIYRNGKFVEDRPLPGPPATSNAPFLIGANGGWGQGHFTGDAGLIRILNGVLSADQVRAEYEAIREGRPPIDFGSTSLQVPGIYKPAQANDTALEFDGQRSYVTVPHAAEQNPADALTVGAWIRPENVMPANIDEQGYIVSKGSSNRAGYMLTTYYTRGLAALVVTDEGAYTATAANVLRQGEWQHAAFVWGNSVLQLYVDGQPVGKPVVTKGSLTPYPGPFTVGKAADRDGQFFRGGVDDVRVFTTAVAADTAGPTGEEVVLAASNTDPSGVVQTPSHYIAGLKEQRPPLVDFEDLTGWTATSYRGITEGNLYRSREKALWGGYVAKVVFRGLPIEAPEKKRIVLRPPQPIPIRGPFDAVNLWVYGKYYYRPGGYTASLQYEDADGKVQSLTLDGRSGPHSNTHRVFWGGWSIARAILPQPVAPPARFLSLTLYDIVGDAEQMTYLDSLDFYVRDKGPVQCEVPAWKDLPFPTTPDTILPALSKGVTYTNAVRRDGDAFVLSYAGSDETLDYRYAPEKGTLSDITASHNAGTRFAPCLGGGIVLSVTGETYAPDDPRVRKTLESAQINGNAVNTIWRCQVGDHAFQARIGLAVKQKSLILSIAADTDAATEVRFGSASGVPAPKLVDLPYLVIGRGMHPSTDAALLYSNGLFLSAFADWYNSDASELFGEQKVLSEDSAICNGGSAYFPTTAGRRNPPRERFFITVSSKLAEALPSIPNPPSPRREQTRKLVWASQGWHLDARAYQDILDGKAPPYYDQQYAFWKQLKSYGVDDLFVHFRIDEYHPGVQQTDTRDGAPESSWLDEDPRMGGNEAVRVFVRRLEDELGYTAVPYTNYTISSPLNYRYWDENQIALWPDGAWRYGAGPAYMIRPGRTLACAEFFNPRLKERFGFRASYADQYTARPPWGCNDYDARTPDAGKFSVPFRVFGELLRRQREQFGEMVFSEGNMQWFFAGLCDANYAMLPTIDQPLLVDFRVLKMNPLAHDYGFHLRYYAGGDLHWWVASEIAFGNLGMVYGRSWLPPHPQRVQELLKSYFLIKQIQQHYATVPVERIGYNNNGAVVSTEEAIKTDAYKNNQVYLKYANGLEVYVNRNTEKNWTVTLNGKNYDLPPNGFAAELPGTLLEYSALSGDKRVDFVQGPDYLYWDGGGAQCDFGPVRAAQRYIVRHADNTVWLIPVPFMAEDTVTLSLARIGLKTGATTRVTVCDADGKPIKSAEASETDGQLTIRITPDAFKLRIEQD